MKVVHECCNIGTTTEHTHMKVVHECCNLGTTTGTHTNYYVILNWSGRMYVCFAD